MTRYNNIDKQSSRIFGLVIYIIYLLVCIGYVQCGIVSVNSSDL